MTTTNQVPAVASSAILVASQPVPEDAISVKGPNFDQPVSFDSLLASYERIGFQANSLGKAVRIINEMVRTLLAMSWIPYVTIIRENGDYLMNRLHLTNPRTTCPLK